jgi:hypothetical protein
MIRRGLPGLAGLDFVCKNARTVVYCTNLRTALHIHASVLSLDVGATQLAGVGVALSVFNTTTKLFNVPLLSVTTSSVAAAAGREAAARAAAASSSSSVDGGTSTAAAVPAGGSLSSAISSSTLIAAGVGVVQVTPGEAQARGKGGMQRVEES